MPDDDEPTPDTDRTPVEPILERRKTSKNMMAIGWVDCPACVRNGVVDPRADCGVCWDEDRKEFCRRVPVDVAIKWNLENS